MRFHFNLVGESTTPDSVGQELEDAVHAAEVGDAIAKKLVHDDPVLAARDCSVVVTDENGIEVHRVNLRKLVD